MREKGVEILLSGWQPVHRPERAYRDCPGLGNKRKESVMKKMLLVAAVGLSLAAGAIAVADPVHDWHDLDKVHNHVMESIHELERARAANHYDMAGHGAKAEELLHQAERELHEAVEAAKAAR
jgi:hypothetical protein